MMSSIASINPDGVRAREIAEALAEDIEEELGHAKQFARRIKELYGVDWATQDMVIEILRDEEGHRRLLEGFPAGVRGRERLVAARRALGAIVRRGAEAEIRGRGSDRRRRSNRSHRRDRSRRSDRGSEFRDRRRPRPGGGRPAA